MKKLWHKHDYREMAKRHADRSCQRRVAFKARKRKERFLLQKISADERRVRNQFKHLPRKCELVAPNKMCFLENPEEMASFISSLQRCLRLKIPVFVDMERVELMQLNAITVLLAVMVDFKSSGIMFGGNTPTREDVKSILAESRFFYYLSRDAYESGGAYDLPGNSIHTHGQLSVDVDFAERLLWQASDYVWGEPRLCRGAGRVLVELMQNTHEHASLDRPGRKRWWVSLQHVSAEGRAIFCFVDFGVGIFESLEQASHPLSNAISTIRSIIGAGGNEKLLEQILTGRLQQSATGNPYRGKGLPAIYDAMKDGEISNLAIIANDVRYASSDGSYSLLRNSFSGTFVSWELNTNNSSIPC